MQFSQPLQCRDPPILLPPYVRSSYHFLLPIDVLRNPPPYFSSSANVRKKKHFLVPGRVNSPALIECCPPDRPAGGLLGRITQFLSVIFL